MSAVCDTSVNLQPSYYLYNTKLVRINKMGFKEIMKYPSSKYLDKVPTNLKREGWKKL